MSTTDTTGPLQAAEVDRARVLAAGTGTSPGDLASWRSSLADPRRPVLARRVDGAIVGVVRLQVAGDEAEVVDLAVDPAHRGRGHGRALVDAALATAGATGARRLLLEVRTDNRAALGLYLGAGFAEVGRRPRYYADGTDAVVLAAPLG